MNAPPLSVIITGPLIAQLLVSGALTGSVYALLGTSFNVIYATTRRFHFVHGLVYTLAAYGAVVAHESWGAPLWAACLFGLASGVCLGVLVEVVVYRSLEQHGSTPLGVFLASLGLTIAGTNLVQIVFGANPRALQGFPTSTLTVGSVTFTNLNLLAAAMSWVCVGLLVVFLRKSRHGMAVRAVQSNPQMARAVGIDQLPVHVLVFALGSAMMGIGGLFFALGQVAQPTMGAYPILIALIAAFIGGIGNMIGSALGGFLVGLTTSLSQLWLSSDTSVVFVFGLLFALLIVRPQGLLGRLAR